MARELMKLCLLVFGKQVNCIKCLFASTGNCKGIANTMFASIWDCKGIDESMFASTGNCKHYVC